MLPFNVAAIRCLILIGAADKALILNKFQQYTERSKMNVFFSCSELFI